MMHRRTRNKAEGDGRPETFSRREALVSGAALIAGGAALLTRPEEAHAEPPRALGFGGYTPVTAPNGGTLPFKMVGGVKEFALVAEPVKREFAPGMVVNCWGYNGMTP